MNENQEILANRLIKYFRDKTGIPVEFINVFNDNSKSEFSADEVRYVLSLLASKGLIKQDIVFYEPRQSAYFLTTTGWLYNTWNEYQSEELRIKQESLRKEKLETDSIESSISTNRNIRRNNRVIAVSTALTAFFALVSAWVSYNSFRSSEKLKPSIESLNSTLLKQVQQQEQSTLCLKEINRSIQNLNPK